MANQKAVITFIFETGKEPKATIFNKYGENDSLKGSGTGLIKLALDDVISLIKEPLTEERLLPRKKINNNNNN